MTRRVFGLVVLLLLAGPGWAVAAQIEHAYTEQTTPQSVTSTTFTEYAALASDWSGAALSSGSGFTNGKKYLLWVTAQIATDSTTSTNRPEIRVVHGSTEFADSLRYAAPTTAARFHSYQWFHVWTAMTGEKIAVEAKVGGTSTATLDQITLKAINLSDDVTENTDWFFAEDGTDDALAAAGLTDGAAVTFTPGTAGHTWLVAGLAQIASSSSTVSYQTMLTRSGEASESEPVSIIEPVNNSAANHQDIILSPKALTLGAASNTFTEQSGSITTDAHTRLHSKVFALNLSKFKNVAVAFTAADLALDTSGTPFVTEIQTLSFVPTQAGNAWIGAWWGYDKAAAARTAQWRLQIDDADQPPTQTADAYIFRFGADNTGEDPLGLQTVESVTATTYDIDMDASACAVCASGAQYRLLWAVTMELAPVGGGTAGPLVDGPIIKGLVGGGLVR